MEIKHTDFDRGTQIIITSRVYACEYFTKKKKKDINVVGLCINNGFMLLVAVF